MKYKPIKITRINNKGMNNIESIKPRRVDDIIISILKVIPKTAPELIYAINKYIDDLVYKPPEYRCSSDCWGDLAQILNYHIPEPKEKWQIQLQRIVNNTTK
jgi:hypothetical protein